MPQTIFKGINSVPPGHYLETRQGKVTITPYWQSAFPTNTNPACRPEADYLDEFSSLLIDATKIRLRADVPVGAYLSGGLDSAVTAAIIKNYTNNQLDTFSIAFSNPTFDESCHQKTMAKHLGTTHHVVQADETDIGHIFPSVIWHTETPLMRTAPAPMYLLSNLVQQHNFKVVLTGEGADEILAGYNIFKEAKIRRFWAKQPDSALRPLLLRRLYPYLGDLSGGSRDYLTGFFRKGLTDTTTPNYSHAIRWRNMQRTKRFFSEEIKQAVDPLSPAYPAEFDQWHPLSRAQYLEMTIFMSQYLLSSQGDRMGMAHSIEGRFPFLDHRVIEFCNNLPPNLKLNGLTEKYLLRQFGHNMLPEGINSRPKQPYRAPIKSCFFNNATPDYVYELLSPTQIEAAGLFKPAAVNQLVDKIERGVRMCETDGMALAGILSSQLVHLQFVAGFKMPPSLSANDDVKACVGVEQRV